MKGVSSRLILNRATKTANPTFTDILMHLTSIVKYDVRFYI